MCLNTIQEEFHGDVSHQERCHDDDINILHHANEVHNSLMLESFSMIDQCLILSLWKGQNKVEHIKVADAIYDTLIQGLESR